MNYCLAFRTLFICVLCKVAVIYIESVKCILEDGSLKRGMQIRKCIL